MDFLKQFTGGKEAKPAGEGKKDDYVDKAFAMLNKKAGLNISRELQEKITDAGRQAFEKATGKKVDPKISN